MFNLFYLFGNPIVALGLGIFWLWMLVDAIRRGEWVWVAFMFFFPGFTTLYYFFAVYRGSVSAVQGFELPGAASRHRIKELEALIHNLDKPHHHLELGDIYFRKGNLAKAETCYRASLERDPRDIDARAHLGQCLLREKRAQEARPILQQVCAENPKHDYGYSMMAYAEALAAVGEVDNAVAVWQRVLREHNYARARVQVGELYLFKMQQDLANVEFREVISDDRHAPSFQRRRDRVWVRRAKRLLR
jgi:tetratricopeptide (TPR) repeat protein